MRVNLYFCMRSEMQSTIACTLIQVIGSIAWQLAVGSWQLAVGSWQADNIRRIGINATATVAATPNYGFDSRQEALIFIRATLFRLNRGWLAYRGNNFF
jgi:cytochrome oxidase assembly protein ShyY1